jgi:choline dehydrogenase-like flavoprotein
VHSDRWAEEVGDERWSWNALLLYFKKTETFIPGMEMVQGKREDIHGYEGPIKVLPSYCFLNTYGAIVK